MTVFVYYLLSPHESEPVISSVTDKQCPEKLFIYKFVSVYLQAAILLLFQLRRSLQISALWLNLNPQPAR